ncbi:MAG TPA: hypothetical protein VGP44_12035, partial [Gemmatimonadales bacterium]|nr:hypothetical protein [Gemmatimonadales bacterium]
GQERTPCPAIPQRLGKSGRWEQRADFRVAHEDEERLPTQAGSKGGRPSVALFRLEEQGRQL